MRCTRPVPPGVTQPARVRALNQLIGRSRRSPTCRWPWCPSSPTSRGCGPRWPVRGRHALSRPNASLTTRVQTLQADLGKGTDYQGALAYAYTLIASDIADVQRTSPEQLPRTRYVVVFLTDGTPYPRCAATDDLRRLRRHDHPELLWADSSGSGDFCNQIDSEDIITGFVFLEPIATRTTNCSIM